MQTKITGSPSFAYLTVDLAPGEAIVAESDAMATMSADLEMKTKFSGGFFKALMKKFLGGESLFINTFTNNTSETRQINLVQPTPGDMRAVELNDSSICLQPGAFICCTPGMNLGIKYAGFASFFGREGLFKLMVSGTGTLWYGAFGGLLDKEISGEYIVDSGHLVAYDPGIKLKVQLSGGIFSSFFSGEGFVTRLEGRGKVTLQTRSMGGLRDWLNPKL